MFSCSWIIPTYYRCTRSLSGHYLYQTLEGLVVLMLIWIEIEAPKDEKERQSRWMERERTNGSGEEIAGWLLWEICPLDEKALVSQCQGEDRITSLGLAEETWRSILPEDVGERMDCGNRKGMDIIREFEPEADFCVVWEKVSALSCYHQLHSQEWH